MRKVWLLVIAAVLTLGCKTLGDITIDLAQYCREHPEECGRPTPTPHPTATPASSATPLPTALPTFTAAPPTPIPTLTPVPTAPPEPPACVPAPSEDPVSLRQAGGCRRGYEPVQFQDDPTLCVIKAGEGNKRTSWLMGYGLFRQGMELANMRGALVQKQDRGCTDAHGRFYPGCGSLYTHPEGFSAPYTFGGYTVPEYCGAATPTPVATPTPLPGGPSCAAVEAIEHWLVGAGGPHAWHPVAGGRVHVVVDTTVRPICDEEHPDNWNTFCGQQSHDPAGYNTAAGAQDWTFSGHGIEDLGPNGCDTAHPHETSPDCNSAQRVFRGPAGGEVKIVVCLRPGQVTDRGCPLPLRADPCSHQTWTLPGAETTTLVITPVTYTHRAVPVQTPAPAGDDGFLGGLLFYHFFLQ